MENKLWSLSLFLIDPRISRRNDSPSFCRKIASLSALTAHRFKIMMLIMADKDRSKYYGNLNAKAAAAFLKGTRG
ncbi:MAG: hypothetical protein PQJ60_14000 [Spirochaetales bacterium]|nr:hypothetical protein [Spirochaetales bacterium]